VRPVSAAPYDRTAEQTVKGFSKKESRPEPTGQDALKICRLAADQGVDLGVFRKSAELFFGESESAVDLVP